MVLDFFYWFFVGVGILLFLGVSVYIAFKMVYAEKYRFFQTEFNRIIGMLASGHHIHLYIPDGDENMSSIRVYKDSKFCISYDANDSRILLSWIRKIERIKEKKGKITLITE